MHLPTGSNNNNNNISTVLLLTHTGRQPTPLRSQRFIQRAQQAHDCGHTIPAPAQISSICKRQPRYVGPFLLLGCCVEQHSRTTVNVKDAWGASRGQRCTGCRHNMSRRASQQAGESHGGAAASLITAAEPNRSHARHATTAIAYTSTCFLQMNPYKHRTILAHAYTQPQDTAPAATAPHNHHRGTCPASDPPQLQLPIVKSPLPPTTSW